MWLVSGLQDHRYLSVNKDAKMPLDGPLKKQSSVKTRRYVCNQRHAGFTGSICQPVTEFTYNRKRPPPPRPPPQHPLSPPPLPTPAAAGRSPGCAAGPPAPDHTGRRAAAPPAGASAAEGGGRTPPRQRGCTITAAPAGGGPVGAEAGHCGPMGPHVPRPNALPQGPPAHRRRRSTGAQGPRL